MASRRQCREWVVQLLFILDMNKQELDQLFSDFWSDREAPAKARKFTEEHVRDIVNGMDKLDEVLRKYSHNWDLHRIGVIERNVIRMAIYEILFRDDIPAVVSINEAVDLAKYFGNTESGRFVNGILDNLRKAADAEMQAGAEEHGEAEADQG